MPALEAVSRELSLEVQRTFDYFASTAESERIGKIVLAGGCAQLPGLSDYLSSNWGIPVELAKPFQRIEIDPGYADEVHAAGPSGGRRRSGAAAAGGQSPMIRINLAPERGRRRRVGARDQAGLAGLQSRLAVRRRLPGPVARARCVLVVADEHAGQPHRRHRSRAEGSGPPQGPDRPGEQGCGTWPPSCASASTSSRRSPRRRARRSSWSRPSRPSFRTISG